MIRSLILSIQITLFLFTGLIFVTPGYAMPEIDFGVSIDANSECFDGIDNDGDGYIDYGTSSENDLGCDSEDDDSEGLPDPSNLIHPSPIDLSEAGLVRRQSQGGVYLVRNVSANSSSDLDGGYLGNIDIFGLAYPDGEVSLLKNDQVIVTTKASDDGSFAISHDYDGESGYELLFVGTTTTDGTLATPISFPLSIKLTVPATNPCGIDYCGLSSSSSAITYTFPSLMHLIFYLIIVLLLLLIIIWLLLAWLRRARREDNR